MPEQDHLRHLLLPSQMTGLEFLKIARTISPSEVVVLGVSGHEGSVEFPDYPLTLDFNGRTAVSESRETELTLREFALVGQLATRPDEVISRDDLFELAWRTPLDSIDSHVVDVHLSNARRKLLGILPISVSPIQNIRSKGFVFYSKPKM
jgi:DNA-binding response OmpR family regulator